MTTQSKSIQTGDVKKFLLKKFPTSEYIDCPIPKHHWETIQEYANAYHASALEKQADELPSDEMIEHKAQLATNDEDYYNFPHVFWFNSAKWMKGLATLLLAKKDAHNQRMEKELLSIRESEKPLLNKLVSITHELEEVKYDLECRERELKYYDKEPMEDDFERYPLPICFDPREELKELNLRKMRINDAWDKWKERMTALKSPSSPTDMQTLESCQDEVAVKLGYKNWDDYVNNGIESSADSEMYKLLSAENEALTLYASQLPKLVSPTEKETDAVEFAEWLDKYCMKVSSKFWMIKSDYLYALTNDNIQHDLTTSELYAKFKSHPTTNKNKTMRYFNLQQHAEPKSMFSGDGKIDISELENTAKEITEEQAKQRPKYGSGNIAVNEAGEWKWEATYHDTTD